MKEPKERISLQWMYYSAMPLATFSCGMPYSRT